MNKSARDLYVIARNAGFSKATAITAGAVALAESGGNPNATHRNSNGSSDYGLWQINSVHDALLAGHDWSNPTENAKMAYVISSGGRNWSPWVTYKNGAYRVYVGRMRAAAAGRDAGVSDGATALPITPGTDGTVAAPASLVGGTADFIGSLTDGSTWVRIGMVLAGGLLLALTVALILGRDLLSVRRTVGL